MTGSKIFAPSRSLGYVSNHIPLKVRYIKSRNENLIVTCVGKSFNTYSITHFSLLSVSDLHPGEINCIAVDTYHVYTACDKQIYAWRRGTEIKHTYRGHTSEVRLLCPFGSHLISVDDKSIVKVWDIKSETLFMELTFGNGIFNITTLLHPSTYINKILFGSEQGQMQLWNINNAKLIYTFKGWKSSITCLEQAPAIDVIAAGLSNGKIILHNLKYDETVMEFTQDWGLVTSISFNSNENIMATGSTIGHIVFWDLEERKISSQLLSAHDRAVTGMEYLPNEPLLLSSSPDNTLKLWVFDMTNGGPRLLRIREGHSAAPTYVRYHGDNGHNILSCAGDSTLRIFNTQTEMFNKNLGKASYNRKASKRKNRFVEDTLKMPPIIQFASEPIREKQWDNIVAIHEGLAMVTTWSYDKVKMGNLKLLPNRFQKNNIDVNVTAVATCLALSHCGNFVVIGYNTGHVDRFNLQSGIWRGDYGKPKAHDCPVRGIAIDTYNQVVVTGGSEGEVKFWKFAYKEGGPMTVLNVDEPVTFIQSHRESSMLAIALDNFTILIADIDTHRIIRKFVAHTAQVTDVSFSPDSRWLISSSMDCSIRTWDVPSGQLVDEFATDLACISLSMSPTGEYLVTAHVDCLGVFLWSNKTIYAKVTLKALTPSEEPPLVILPEFTKSVAADHEAIDGEDENTYLSPEQISENLISLSGLSSSCWQNLLDVETIRQRNKPKTPPKVAKAAPFFLPTVSSLNDILFDVKSDSDKLSRITESVPLTNSTEFGMMLRSAKDTNDFSKTLKRLKSFGPSMIHFEINSLCSDDVRSKEVVMQVLQFFKLIEFVLKSNGNFELAEAYMSIFLKVHGFTIAQTTTLSNYLPNIRSCHQVAWHRIQNPLLYIQCVLKNLKTM